MAEVLRTRIGVLTYLAPSGSLADDASVEAFQKTVNSCVESRELQLVLDLAHATKLNSLALETLLDVQDTLTRMGGWLKVAHLSALHQDIFHITGVSDYVATINPASHEEGASRLASASKPERKLGEILLEKGFIGEDKIQEAMRLQDQTGSRLGKIVLEKRWVSEPQFLKALSEQLNIPCVRLRSGIYDPSVVHLIEKNTARRLNSLPLFRVRGILTLATAEPQSIPSFEEVESVTDCRIRPVLASREEIAKFIDEAYAEDEVVLEHVEDVAEDFQVVDGHRLDDDTLIDEMAGGSPVITLVNSLIQRAVRDGVSDIHIEPFRATSRIRYRIDGILYEVMTPRIEVHPALVSRLKVMANLDIAERRLPQDGRIQVVTQGRNVDLRFSSLPGIFGEKVVLRVLDKNDALLDVQQLGMSPPNLEAFLRLLRRTYGLVLVTGPTGSGKTTTLYAAINHLNSLEKNIVTIEDPVEYQIDVVNQNQVKESIGLSFAKVLKHVLRQDPDIILVGEIRDRETAQIAVQAALTGHLVLSTLHTNDAVSAVTRMFDMGIEPYMLTSALIGVIAQRLVRKVCPDCKLKYIAPPALVTRYGWQNEGTVRLVRGRGCPECYDSGYRGRLGLHELLEVDAGLQGLMMTNPSRDDLSRYTEQAGHQTLFDDGLQKVRAGRSAIEEVTRVVNLQ